MRDFVLDLNMRLNNSTIEKDFPESLAFAEGRLLSIHPFADFNGRVTRVWLSEILRRLQLAPVVLAPAAGEKTAEYLTALRAADRNDLEPLTRIWMARLSEPT